MLIYLMKEGDSTLYYDKLPYVGFKCQSLESLPQFTFSIDDKYILHLESTEYALFSNDVCYLKF